LLLAACLLATCSSFEPDELKDEDQQYTNVEYSEDGTYLTIYLDGSAPVPANRSLNRKLAELGHDFFEVTFVYRSPTNQLTVARASWELGEPAGVSDVYRTAAGVNYYGTNPVGMPALGDGTAVLFCGRKYDKTLLAVGTLSYIDNTPIAGASNLITTSTTKVTFALNALTAGVVSDLSDSSFQTTYTQPDNPLKTLSIGGKPFPYYYLPINSPENATYTIGVHSETTPYNNYSFYQPAIIYAGGANAQIIEPKYTLPPDYVKNERQEGIVLNLGVGAVITGLTANTPFTGIVNFSITTALVENAICALTFQIPVYAVTTTGPAHITWYIRPGYNIYWQELDGNSEVQGGAVLLGIGVTLGNQESQLYIVGTPARYNATTGFKFNLKGFEIYYKDGSGNRNNLTPISNVNYPSAFGWTANLSYYYGVGENSVANIPITSTTDLPVGDIKIRIVYTIGGVSHSYIFMVKVNDVAATDIPYENRFVFSKPEDFTEFQNAVNGAKHGNFLCIFSQDTNISGMTFNINGNINMFIISIVPGRTIGRSSGARITFSGDQNVPLASQAVKVYLGDWPFNDPAFAGGDVINNENFRVNTQGLAGEYPGGTESTTMFTHNAYASLNVYTMSGVNVSNTALLYTP